MIAWWQWCRLCAKEDNENNINVSSDVSTATAIGKYFWVNIKPTDPTQHICQDCYYLVNQLVSFTERVNKVQAMLCMLQNAKTNMLIDPYELRSQYDLLDEDFDHIGRRKLVKHEMVYDENEETNYESDHDAENMVQDIEEVHDSQEEKDFGTEPEITLNNIDNEANHPGVCLSEDETVNVVDNQDDMRAENECNEVEYEHNETEEDYTDTNEQDEMVINAQKREAAADHSISRISKIQRLDDSINYKHDSREPSKQPRYTCNVCGKIYKNATSFRKHMLETHNTEADIPDFVCEKCNKIFPTVRQLLVHNRAHLPLEKKLIVPCPHCDKKFTLEAVMKQHVSSVHFNEKPFMCEECGLSLKSLASFNDHKITHSTDYPYECEICKKKFKHKTRLKTHMDTHTETAYVCNQCGVRLNTKRTLKMHMLVHSEEKAYKCNFCDAEFKRGKALKNHLILHIGLRPYKCNFCGKTFTNGSNCRSHKKRFHPAELAAEEAAGLKTEPTSVPKISELRARDDIKRPAAISRNSGGLPPRMKALLIAAEQRSKEKAVKLEEQGSVDEDSRDVHLILEETDDEKDSMEHSEECEETVVYEFIEESKV